MSMPTPIPAGLDDKVPDIENLLNVALDTLERVRDAGVVADPVLAADMLDTIGLLIEATNDLAPDNDAALDAASQREVDPTPLASPLQARASDGRDAL